MKILSISRGGLELALVQITKNTLLIGRSPSNDVVLRASGVKPIHFLLEWIGEGVDQWSIFDISSDEGTSGEGVLLTEKNTSFKGFLFQWIENRMEDAGALGGTIKENLSLLEPSSHTKPLGKLLEFVQLRTDTGSVEEILHIRPKKHRNYKKISKNIPEFKIHWQGQEGIKILLEELPGAEIFNKGARVQNTSSLEMKNPDLIRISWKSHDFYIRFVSAIKIPQVKKVFFKDPLLFRLSLLGTLGAALLLAVILTRGKLSPLEETKPPLRVATVEIRNITPPPEPPKEIKEKEPQKTEKAASPSLKPVPGKPRSGLNNPSKPTDINTLGILGALKKTNRALIKPEDVLNQNIITESISGKEGKVVLKNPPSGVLSQEDQKKSNTQDLAQAATSIQGKEISLSNDQGLFVQPGSLGSGKGLIGKGLDFGKIDENIFQVSGGLDRETVRRVIFSYRGQIRTCFERALVTHPKLGGRLVFVWDIFVDGNVLSVEIKKTETRSPVLDSCVQGVIKNMKFPQAANGKNTKVIYPFIFQQKG